jgi:Rps23 Pro-64 3,4-dihydroxylase Tpa1-like proline 4-hydroxylase
LFAPSSVIGEVPYDPNLYFLGEEITLAVRLWTHGWDLFYPNMPVLYTNWDRKYRKTHFEDHRDWGSLNRRSHQRVHYLLTGQEPADSSALDAIEKFGLGSVRTLEEYRRYSGVNFRKKIFNARARDGKPYPSFKGRARFPQRAVRNGTVSLTPRFSEADAQSENSSTVLTVSTPISSANGHHQPRKVFESVHGIVFDDFLPEDLYQKLYHYACTADYEHINTTSKVQRVWRIRDGFPLRSQFNLFHFLDESKRPDPKPDWAYPTNTALDCFAENLSQLSAEAASVIGKRGNDWDRYSVTSWIYPRDTALSLHDDGSGVYSGAFTYFLNPHWDIHWGGLLMFIDPRASKALQNFKTPRNVHDYYKKKWLDASDENAFVWEPGLAQCIFPKRNRIVFIHPESYHFVTKVTADAGENARMSFAGFFMKPEKK